jgi:hypothetical protein
MASTHTFLSAEQIHTVQGAYIAQHESELHANSQLMTFTNTCNSGFDLPLSVTVQQLATRRSKTLKSHRSVLI